MWGPQSMVVSDEKRILQEINELNPPSVSAPVAMTERASTTKSPASAETESTRRNANGAANAAFAPLPFDEQLISAATSRSTSTATSVPSSAHADSAFFVDTAMLAQQIAAVVADEKKLSDSIMDFIPPPGPVALPTSSSAATSSAFAGPLEPPPGLVMRALSPPMSLLPEFSQPTVPHISLETSTTATTSSAPITATSSTSGVRSIGAPTLSASAGATKMTAAASVAATVTQSSLAMSGNDSGRKESVLSSAAMLRKRKSAEAFGDRKENPGVPTSLAQAVPPTSLSSMNSGLAGSSSIASAREKVMKEPQSGDLYECVITKRNGGLGLTLACVDDHVQITGLAPDTPAANSGICVGDTLVAVSGLPVRGLQFSTVIGRLKSTSRNSVVLKLRRNPFRQNGNSSAPYRNMKRPTRPTPKSSESNSANVLSSKSMALESRIGGANATAASMSASNTNHAEDPRHANGMKMEPANTSYFPTDASILTMGPSGMTDPQWRVLNEEKERYYSECRSLKHELSHVMASRRLEKRNYEHYTWELQKVVDHFQQEIQATFQKGNEDLVALRQKLLEVNHALAKQQTEILELKEREARHSLPESQRVKMQLILLIKKNMQSMDLKAVAAASKHPTASHTTATGDKSTQQHFKETIEGIRPSVFELLFRPEVKPDAIEVELDLDTRACTQTFGWNLREIVSQGNLAYVVFVEDTVHVRYVRALETLELSWQFKVQEFNY